MTELNKAVLQSIEEEGTKENQISYMQDVLEHGCVSGVVTELIYYTDAEKFYENHQDDINDLLADMLDITGFTSPKELFGDKWDETDPLAKETQNQNLLAWFGYEESVRDILENDYNIEF